MTHKWFRNVLVLSAGISVLFGCRLERNPVPSGAVGPTPAGRTATVSAPKQDLLTVLTGNSGPPVILLLYYDDTPSRQNVTPGHGAQVPESGRWQDLSSRAIAFLQTAPRGSRLEIWTTDAAAGHPALRFEKDIVPLRRAERQADVQAVYRRLDAIDAEIRTNPPSTPTSPILEDTRRLVDRAAALGHVSYVVINTDAQQFSPFLRYSDILKEPDGSDALLNRVLKQMPRSEKPPACMTLVYSPGNSKQGGLNAHDDAKLKRFFLRLFEAWGSHGELVEPRDASDSAR